jgi:hypothetical protein
MGGMASRMGIPEGKATATIYGLIREQKYGDAINLLNVELQNFPRSRAALSLLGYCYYYLQDFRAAALVSQAKDCPRLYCPTLANSSETAPSG